ncbi:uncharacterized protein LOC133320295 [Danaus plexippus]|uniref:uncharacterized protein LOC133320295 n=1 Tax=Danaus plexippus TaxID=13037 RepID=UPI002AB2F48F|nr:uncharacterized protein LOC133320295 [Danaus plexippus]
MVGDASVSYILYYVYTFLQLFSSLDFIANCTQVLYRLQTIGDELQYHGRDTSNLSVLYGETVDDVLIKKNQLKTNSSRAVAKPIHRQNIVNIVTGSYRCYLLLIDQSSYINKVFGFRILINCINFLIRSLENISSIIGLLVDRRVVRHGTEYLPIITTSILCVFNFLVIFYMIHICEQNYRQNERIIDCIDRVPGDVQMAAKFDTKLRC